MKFLVKLAITLGILGALAIGAIFLFISELNKDLPEVKSLRNYNPPAITRIYSRDGEVLLELAKEKRILKEVEDIPPKVINAILAAEDDQFYNHSGVDYFGTFRALIKNILAGRVVQGGSTITQQVAKYFLLSSERTYTRKIKDMLLAKKIEEKFSKDEILYLYLNQVFFGSGYHGIAAAGRGYFNKELNELTVAEAALIAGLLVAPSKYSPFVNPERAKFRQRYVLKRLNIIGQITDDEYRQAIDEKITLVPHKTVSGVGEYYSDYIRWKIVDEIGDDAFLSQGLEIHSAMDFKLQQLADRAVLNGAKKVDRMRGYRGPLKKVESDQLENEITKLQAKILKEEANLIYLTKDGEHSYEYEEELSKDKPSAQLIKFLQKDKNYPAVVTGIDDQLELAYISIGGVKGIIAQPGFKWAKKRKKNDRWFHNNLNIKKPSSVFEVGDIVLAKILELEGKVINYISTQGLSEQQSKNFEEESVIVAELDQEPEIQAALVALEPYSGDVLALVGGTNFKKYQFNRAIQAKRQPGSAFKPFIYSAALEKGQTAASIIMDTPHALGGFDSTLSWKPRNSDGKFMGPLTLRRCLELSRNIPAIKTLQEVGIGQMKEFTKRVGIDAELPKDLGISLGTFGVDLLQLTKSYSIFVNGGRMIEPRFVQSILDKKDNKYNLEVKKDKSIEVHSVDLDEVEDPLVGDFELDEESVASSFQSSLGEDQVYDVRLSYIMNSILRGVVQNGTAKKARDLGTLIGGKTGTTNSNVDAWFIGFSPKLLVGVWVGLDDNTPMGRGASGGGAALPIWEDFMKEALELYGMGEYAIPSGIVKVKIDPKTGMAASSLDQNAYDEFFVLGTEPGGEYGGVNSKNVKEIILEERDFFEN